jgi:hypothetical protein
MSSNTKTAFMKVFHTLLIVSSICFSSCRFFGGERISGNGHISSQQKSAGSFNSVRVSGGIKVHVSQETTQAVKIETDQNLMQYIDVYNDGNTLVIKEKSGYNLDPTKDIIAYVSAPLFKDIDVSGSCDIIGDNIISGSDELSMHVSGSGDIIMQVNCPKVNTEISGSGSVNLKGQVTDFNAEVSGAGDIRCYDLITDNTRLDLSGSSDAEVTANKQLKVDASGSSTVTYKGTANVSQQISGSGSVRKAG